MRIQVSLVSVQLSRAMALVSRAIVHELVAILSSIVIELDLRQS
jgi:hypothetical protein